jgi:hypothetical protein
MHHIKPAAIAIFLSLGLGAGVTAQTAIPDFRYRAAPDTDFHGADFHGADLDPLFGTDLDSCVRACTAMDACAGFTFNARAQACFPKAAMTGRSGCKGALSAEKVPADPAIAPGAETRAAALSFLGHADLDGARDQARLIGLGQSGGKTAMIAAAIARSGDAALWALFAPRLLEVETDDYRLRETPRARATHAAINAYLRGETPDARALALLRLSRAPERAGRGRDMIATLRLAEQTPPSADIVMALNDAIGKYGFRVTNSTVESDAAAHLH